MLEHGSETSRHNVKREYIAPESHGITGNYLAMLGNVSAHWKMSEHGSESDIKEYQDVLYILYDRAFFYGKKVAYEK